jgi:orotidine-5'-phosphate decarboxylase
MPSKASLSYGERARLHRHPVARRLFEIAEQKKTNLVVAADMGSTDSLLYLADGEWPPPHSKLG